MAEEFDKDHASVGGQAVHRSSFAYVGDPSDKSSWKLPIHDEGHIRNALARFNQTEPPADKKAEVARKLVAAAKAHGIDASGFEKEHSLSELPLSEVKDGLVKIAIAHTGKGFKQGEKEFDITARDLEQMSANLNRREAPLDYEHLSGQTVPPGWSKAAGWLKRSAGIDGDTLFAWAEFTPACLAAVREREYRYFSPEIHWHDVDEHGQPIGTRLAAGAITNRPFLKALPPIEISAADYPQLVQSAALSESKRLLDLQSVHVPAVVNSETEKARKTMAAPKQFKLRRLSDGEHKGKVGVFDGDDMAGLCDGGWPDADDDKETKATELRLAEEKKNDAAFLGECAKMPAGGDILALAEKAAADGRLSQVGQIRAQRVAKLVDDAIAAGKILGKNREHYFCLAAADYDSLAAVLKEAHPVVDLKAHGIAGDGSAPTAKQEMEAKVAAYMAERKDKKGNPVKRAVALSEITRQEPELWERYKSECAVRTQ